MYGPVASSTLAHRMCIGFVAIYGEVYVATSATNANVDVNREWTQTVKCQEHRTILMVWT